MSWPDTRITRLFGIDAPLLLSPMAGAGGVALALAIADSGGLGALPMAMRTPEQADVDLAQFRAAGARPVNVNFFCHDAPVVDAAVIDAWFQRLARYTADGTLTAGPPSSRAAFDERWCDWIERTRPEVVSFHFGLPPEALLARVKATGARVIASATTVAEAVWLEQRGCDAVIAQGAEAGGHRAMFLATDVHTQVGTFALVPQIVDAVRVPVIAAGGIADGRGVAAALTLGASAAQIGSAFLRSPESSVTDAQRDILASATDESTVITNVITGRPARGVANRLMREEGPMSDHVPPFPLAAEASAALRQRSPAFAYAWAGQAVHLARAAPARDVARSILADALARL